MKAVFDTKPTSVYDDDIAQHYQFPRRYLATVEKCVGDWIVLRRPRADGGNLAYFAVARVVNVDRDSDQAGMSYARFADYLPFVKPVPWTTGGRYAEEALRNIPQVQVGVYLRGRSVRPLAEADFADLLKAGLRETLDTRNAERVGVPAAELREASLPLQTAPAGEREWRVETVLSNRIVRDANFRLSVYEAYDNRCAITNLRIFDAKGNSEVHGAHIWAVADGGPDVVQNGLALSGTVHWLFDHYLISLTDDHLLLIAESKIPSELRTLFPQQGAKIFLPSKSKDWPHPSYIEKHRAIFEERNGKRAIVARGG